MPYKDPIVAKAYITEYRKLHRDTLNRQMQDYYNKNHDEIRKSQNINKSKPEVKIRQRHLYVQRNYNLTPEQHLGMLEKQNYRCAFPHCGVAVDLFSPIDHNHGCCPITARSCGRCVRSVLCQNHNIGLGQFEQLNPECLIDAYNYLKSNHAQTT